MDGRKKERKKQKKQGRKEGMRKERTHIDKGSRGGSKELKEGRKKEVSQAQQGNDRVLRFSNTHHPNYVNTKHSLN